MRRVREDFMTDMKRVIDYLRIIEELLDKHGYKVDANMNLVRSKTNKRLRRFTKK